jgi:hypothetical protein
MLMMRLITKNDLVDISRSANRYHRIDRKETFCFTLPKGEIKRDIIENNIMSRVDRAQNGSDIKFDESGRIDKYVIEAGEKYICELPDVSLYVNHNVALTNQGNFVASVMRRGQKRFQSMSTLSKLRFFINNLFIQRRSYDIDIAIPLTYYRRDKDIAYGHWLLEQLPKLRGIRRFERITGYDTKIIVNNGPEWRLNRIEQLGFDSNRIIETDKNLRIRKLIIPSETKFGNNSQHSTEDYNWIRCNLKQGTNYQSYINDFSKYIYISREEQNRRRITNRTEIMSFLSNLGFEKVIIENLSAGEQISVFMNAEIVVGPIGSAFSNIIFCDDASILLIHPPDTFVNSFYELSQIYQIDYYSILGEDTTPEETLDRYHSDIYVDKQKMQKMINNILNNI